MPKSTIDKIKDQLVQEKKRLEKELSGFAQKGKRGFKFIMSSFGSKDEEHVADVANLDNNISLSANLEKSLRDVDEALEKVDQGAYGICKLCNQPIEPPRLKVFPAATTCVNCIKAKKPARP